MRRPGFTGRGFYQDKLMLGPGGSDITISVSTAIAIPGANNLYPGAVQDIVCRNLTVNNLLLPTVQEITGADRYATLKMIVRDTLTLNTSGIIGTSGKTLAGGGVWSNSNGCLGYKSPFEQFSNIPGYTLGGSGSGGNANPAGAGVDGNPSVAYTGEERIYWGGNGGAGKQNGVDAAGAGGICSPFLGRGNLYAPSVYLEGITYDNLDGSVFPHCLFPYRLCGGGGGGGAGNDVSGTGGGAAGAGVCYIAADKLIFNGGHIDCSGGFTNTGGGGGGGGLVILNVGEIDWISNTSTIFCSGGSSGSGTFGSAGTVLIFSNDLVAKFTGDVSKSMYDAAVVSFNSN